MERTVLFHGPGRSLEIERHPTPRPAGAEVLVRVTRCTLCASDLHTHAGRRAEGTPVILGHEIVGRVEAFGPAAPRADLAGQPLRVGDRLTWGVAVGCGGCFFCATDLPQKCERLVKYGHAPGTPFSGGLADVVVLAAGTALLRVPDELPDELAAPANCATATVAAVLRAAGDLTGRTVLVLGAGVLGLTASAMARAAGATVVVEDPDPARQAKATAFGAEATSDVNEMTNGRGADVVFELAGARAAVEAALTRARVGGTVVLAGTVSPTSPVALDPERVVRRLLTIRGVHNYAPRDLRTAIDFLAGPGAAFPFRDLAGPMFSLADADAAFAYAHANPGTRVAVVPTGVDS